MIEALYKYLREFRMIVTDANREIEKIIKEKQDLQNLKKEDYDHVRNYIKEKYKKNIVRTIHVYELTDEFESSLICVSKENMKPFLERLENRIDDCIGKAEHISVYTDFIFVKNEDKSIDDYHYLFELQKFMDRFSNSMFNLDEQILDVCNKYEIFDYKGYWDFPEETSQMSARSTALFLSYCHKNLKQYANDRTLFYDKIKKIIPDCLNLSDRTLAKIRNLFNNFSCNNSPLNRIELELSTNSGTRKKEIADYLKIYDSLLHKVEGLGSYPVTQVKKSDDWNYNDVRNSIISDKNKLKKMLDEDY